MKRSLIVCAVACTAYYVLLSGCAVGRGPAGEIILGVEAGQLVETAGQAVATGLNLLVPGLGAVGVAIGAPILAAVRANRKRRRADQGRERAEKEALRHRVVLEERERNGQPAATVET